MLEPPDLDGARIWYRRAAEADSTDAMLNLGHLLANRSSRVQIVKFAEQVVERDKAELCSWAVSDRHTALMCSS